MLQKFVPKVLATASKSSLVRGLPAPVRCPSTTSQIRLDANTLIKHYGSSKSIARLSSAIQVLECLETIAECSQIPGLHALFHVLVKLLNAVKDTKENSENAKYLLGLTEAHLKIALDSVCPKDDPLFNLPPMFLEYFIETLVEIGEFTTEVKKRGPFASLRHVLSDKQELQALTKKLNDGLHLFLNGSISEIEKRRLSSQTLTEEIAILLGQFLEKSEEIGAKLDQISTRLDKIEQRSNQDFCQRIETEPSQRTTNFKEAAPLHPTNIQPLLLFTQLNIRVPPPVLPTQSDTQLNGCPLSHPFTQLAKPPMRGRGFGRRGRGRGRGRGRERKRGAATP